MDEARVWATQKNSPNTGGWITLFDVENILAALKPKPLPQSFRIPEDYVLPSDKFHNKLLSDVVKLKKNILVVTGPPGRGKSTYLSFFTQELNREKIPYIRHHYFISLEDKTGDRFSHFSVQNDLMHQLKHFHGASADSLHEAMQVCAMKYEDKNKPLVVLIDGLDHIWRDNNGDINPLDSLFNTLLPPLKNIIYILGTQPVEDLKLPKKLIQLTKRSEWLTLPPLSGNSILKQITNLVESNRLLLNCHKRFRNEYLSESAESLYKLTLGHPLSLIYVTEQLIASKTPISSYEVDKLPKIFGLHIYDYYEGFWRAISYPQKYALHIICEFNFGWEKVHLNELVSNEELDDHIAGVQHLLFRSRTGYKSFHESLVAFVKGLPEHESIIEKHKHDVIGWIKSHASTYIKNIWTIKFSAKFGMYDEVSSKLTRDWVVHRLSEGYFPRELESILETSTLNFMKQGYMSEAHRLRTIKTRVSNASHNVHELDRLIELTLKRAPVSVINEYLSINDQLTTEELAQLSICLHFRNNKTDSEQLNKLAIDSYNANNLLRTRKNDNKHEVSEIFRSEILLEHDISANIKKFDKSYHLGVIQSCLESRDLKALMKYHGIFHVEASSANAEQSLYRLAVAEGINPKTILDESSLNKSAFLKFARKSNSPTVDVEFSIFKANDKTTIKSLSSSYSEEFFHILNILFSVGGDCSWLKCDLNLATNYSNKDEEPTKILTAINEAAAFVFHCLCYKQPISFSGLLDFINDIDLEYGDHWQQQTVNDFLFDFSVIALDCHILFNHDLLPASETSYLVESELFNNIRFFHWYAEQKLPLLTNESAQLLLDAVLVKIPEYDIQEKAHLLIAAAEMLSIHDMTSNIDLYIQQAWDLAIGYGSYKDYTISGIIDSVEYSAELDQDSAIKNLKRLSPFISSFDTFTTEGSLPEDTINRLLAKLSPSTIASKYKNELLLGEAADADNTLTNFLEYGDLSSSLLINICRTGLLSENLKALDRRADKGNKHAQKLLNIALEHNASRDVKTANKKSKDVEEKAEFYNFDDYPPAKFLDFVKNQRERRVYGEESKAWFDFWVSDGKQEELLDSLIPIVLTSDEYAINYFIDDLFELSMTRRGKQKSFPLLIAAHNHKKGWGSFYEAGTAFHRLDTVAEVYPDRADEFVSATTFENEAEGLTLPYHRYTYLLCKLKRKEEAIEFVNSMIHQLLDETTILSANDPKWIWEKRELDDLLLDILIARLNIPLSSVKWWVAQQLVALLLIPELSKKLEDKLLFELSVAEQELSCLEILGIFYFAHLKGYTLPPSLPQWVTSKSFCSDLMFDKMGVSSEKCKSLFDASLFNLSSNMPMQKSFDRANGIDFPKIYYNSLETLQSQSRLPIPSVLTDIMRSEWIKMQITAESHDSNLSYYINSAGYAKDMTSIVYPYSGLRARSAYLRSLKFAEVSLGLPRDIHKFNAQLAFPFDPLLFFITPEKSISVEKYRWSDKVEQILGTVTELVSDLDNESDRQQLGAISFSVQVNEQCFLKVDVIRSQSQSRESSAEIELPWIWREQKEVLDDFKVIVKPQTENPLSLLATKTYPFQHFAHWHSEVETRGIYCPVPYKEDIEIIMSENSNMIEYSVDSRIIGNLQYNNNCWAPAYNRYNGTNTITTLMLDVKHRDIWSCISSRPECFYCNIEVITSSDSYSSFEVAKHHEFLNISHNEGVE